jgi:pyruvate dehydrogenase E2 component (dihydrolipoamide acetyltransferase)
MATVITMPQLSPTMEEGVLLKWTKKEGDKIAPGDVIAEVETDKANMDFPLEDEGTLLKLLVKEGDTVKLGAPVAVLGEPGEDPASALAGVPAKQAAPAAEKPQAAPAKQAAAVPVPVERAADVTARIDKVERAPEPPADGQRVRASPLARKIAAERGVDLRVVSGSGPGGRVVARDVPEQAPARREAPAQKVRVAVARAQLTEQRIPLSPMRKTIARRMVESKRDVPHIYLTREARADALADFHGQIKAALDEGEARPSLNDLILKALAWALTRVPEANASFDGDAIVRHGQVDLGVAVALEDGLVTPVVRAADQKTIGEIARDTRDLIERARARKLKGDEFSGGTFSVTNLGMYGVREFAAVISPPQAGILAVGALEKRAVVVSDSGGERLAIARAMTLTMSLDHRAVDGALGARLLAELVRAIEHPALMVL